MLRWRGSFVRLSVLLALFAWGCAETAPPGPLTSDPRPERSVASVEPATRPREPEEVPAEGSQAPAALTCLAESYPDAIREVVQRDGVWVAVFADGREAPWDDGREKDYETRLDDPDLEDTLAQPYPAGSDPSPPGENVEPGRVRHAMLLENAYGASERAVRAHLTRIPWPGGGSVRFSSRNGAADALRQIIGELSGLPAEARPCVEPPIGSFFHRTIRGTERLSPHAFGIAVDLNTSCGEYWRWQRPFEGRWQSHMPRSLVDLFESHGFAWGGRWYHYDTFHFEYRPELFRCR